MRFGRFVFVSIFKQTKPQCNEYENKNDFDIVNTNVQTMVQIPINSSYSGTYTLVLSNGNGVAEGEFDR